MAKLRVTYKRKLAKIRLPSINLDFDETMRRVLQVKPSKKGQAKT